MKFIRDFTNFENAQTNPTFYPTQKSPDVG